MYNWRKLTAFDNISQFKESTTNKSPYNSKKYNKLSIFESA